MNTENTGLKDHEISMQTFLAHLKQTQTGVTDNTTGMVRLGNRRTGYRIRDTWTPDKPLDDCYLVKISYAD